FLATQRAWIEQLKATDPVEQKRLADERDKLWMEQAPAHLGDRMTMQLIYGMESYSAPIPLVQSTYTLAFPDTSTHMLELNERARLAKEAMVGYFTEQMEADGDFPESRYPALKNSIHLMDQSRAQVYVLMKSGESLGFLFAATNLPNTADVRLKHGAKIFENRRTFTERAEIVHPYLERVFGKDSDEMNRFDEMHINDVIDMLAGVFVPLHEVGHNLAIGPQTREKLSADVETNVEEAKADLAGIVGSGRFLTSQKDRELFLSALFMEELRGLTRRDEHADRSHYNGNIINIQLMITAGALVEKENGQWEFNFNQDTVNAFFEGAKHALQDLVYIYEQPSREAGLQFIETRFAESEEMKELLHQAGIMPDNEYGKFVEARQASY
ncbi:MAG: hypothetical protein KGL95_03120, partial [Patescibacteria group bacterium]|nr:hypothetical protein [Patescibacteria group bacterium]